MGRGMRAVSRLQSVLMSFRRNMKRNKAYHLYAEHQERSQNRNTAGNAAEIKDIEVWTTVTYRPQ